MIHDRLSRLQLATLRRNTTRTLLIQKRPGIRTPEVDDALTAYAPAERDDDGQITHKRETVRCSITAVETVKRGWWKVTYRAGLVEPRRFLRARPGAVKLTRNPDGTVTADGDADYTTSISSAARGEPECMPESWEREGHRAKRSMHRLRDTRPWIAVRPPRS